MKILKISDTKAEVPTFERFYNDNYTKVLFYLVRKTGNQSDAEDLTSEVFMYCFDHYSNYDPSKSSLSTWLFLIVNSRLKNYYRDKKDYTDISDLENYLYDASDDMDKAIYLEQLRKKIADVLESLTEQQRQIVVMRYFKEMEYADIARILGLTAGNVRTILSRTLDRIEKDFKEFAN